MKKLKGSVPALITPMLSNQAVDYDTWAKYTQWHSQQASVAALLLGSTAEAMLLEENEREKLLTIASNSFSSMPYIVGVSALDAQSAIRKAKQAKAFGASAILLSPPYYIRPCQDALLAYFQSVAKGCDIPIILYCIPSRVGVSIANATIKRCAEDPQIIGIKDANDQRQDLAQLISQLPKTFSYLSGDDANCLNLVEQGGDGVVSVGANVLPNQFQYMINSALNKSSDSLDCYQEHLAPLLKVLALGPNPAVIKYLVSKVWGIDYSLRDPLLPLDRQTMDKINAFEIVKECEHA